jgi:uncharacterized protein YdeI (YjbR/CyaY-like superfamily)
LRNVKEKSIGKRMGLKRKINPMPKNIRTRLVRGGLLALYNARPAYQRNDYLGWISRAKLDETKEKRINQMLKELKQGDRYMNMKWSGRGEA